MSHIAPHIPDHGLPPQSVSASAFWDLAATLLWVAFRDLAIVDAAYGAGDFIGLTASGEGHSAVDDLPADTLLADLRKGVPVACWGLLRGGDVPILIGPGQWRFVSRFSGDKVCGNIGSAGPWLGVVFNRSDIMRAYPAQHRQGPKQSAAIIDFDWRLKPGQSQKSWATSPAVERQARAEIQAAGGRCTEAEICRAIAALASSCGEAAAQWQAANIQRVRRRARTGA